MKYLRILRCDTPDFSTHYRRLVLLLTRLRRRDEMQRDEISVELRCSTAGGSLI